MRGVIFRLLMAISLAVPVSGQNSSEQFSQAAADSAENSFRLFEDEEILDITLRFGLSTYFRTKPKNDFLQAVITFNPGKPDSVSRDIRLKTRGVFRNTFCGFAPIELNFKKVSFGYSDLDNITKLKMVTQCQSGTLYADYVLKEYIAYKLFSVLTDTCFRVRLLSINYIDSEKKRRPVSHYGILIEPLEMLAARSNSIEIKSSNLTQKNIDPEVMDRLAIFNYMIGNYDWSIPGRHNVKILKPLSFNPEGLGIAVPYDFDWTGLVDPSYAVPAEVTGLESVRERLFTGICRSREIYLKRLEIFSAKKDEFYRVIEDSPHLSQRAKREMTYFLNGFFKRLENKNNMVDDLLETCKNF